MMGYNQLSTINRDTLMIELRVTKYQLSTNNNGISSGYNGGIQGNNLIFGCVSPDINGYSNREICCFKPWDENFWHPIFK